MVDIFSEVEEELRKDKYLDLFKKYGPWAAAGAALIIAGVAGHQGWNYWRTQQQESASSAFAAAQSALEAQRFEEASAAFEALAADGPSGYAALALMQRAAVALEGGDAAAAAAFYEQAAERTSDRLISDMARLKAAWASWGGISFDDLVQRVSPLTAQGRPMRHLARETIAAAAFADGRYDQARDGYESLSFDIDTPQGVRRRAGEALAVIDAVAPRAAPPAAEAAPEPAPDTAIEAETVLETAVTGADEDEE
ncbi:MAG: tetratricopeptide repeat protein [Maricaulaceae bacterium]|nr:tetratricopeptide repeat protein [Maricaulaceae bacterium]